MTDKNTNSLTTIRNGLIAGYSAAMCGIIVGHPLDSIKVLLQTQHSSTNNARNNTNVMNNDSHHAADTAITRASKHNVNGVTSSSGKANVCTAATVNTTVSSSQRVVTTNGIISARSLGSLYSGMAGPLLASGAVRGLNFAVYDSVRRGLYSHEVDSGRYDNHLDYLHHDSLINVAIASFLSGASTCLLTSPMALIKTKQQIMVSPFRQTIIDTFQSNGGNTKILRGISNFYTGFGVHFTCDAVGTLVYFTSYEWFKRQIAQRKQIDISQNHYHHNHYDYTNNTTVTLKHDLTIPERMICAASSGMICWSVIFPCDVLRSRLYMQSIYNETQLSAVELAKQMIREEGLRSLYRGVGVTVARAGPVAAAVLPVYDCVLGWLSTT
eukprot:scaffold86357_cov74-Cyclotella_meneghiniana.AAC.1